jgi:hypothetical protein
VPLPAASNNRVRLCIPFPIKDFRSFVLALFSFDWTNEAYFELLDSMCFPTNLEAIERACVELGYLLFGHWHGVRLIVCLAPLSEPEHVSSSVAYAD